MYALRGASEEMVDDVLHTTKTNNTEVPAHMWVAHARAERRVAQAFAKQGNLKSAREWAKRAMKVAEDGVGWQDTSFTRRQWLEMVRVLFVVSNVMAPTENPTAVHGKMKFWVEETAKAKPAAWVEADLAKARLLTAQAMERNLYGRVQQGRNQPAQAQKAFAAAAAMIDEALSLREAASAQGVRLPASLPYEVSAAIATSLGKTEEAESALQAARKASIQNPD